MKIGEAHAVGVELIKVRGFKDGVAVAGEVAVALVVGHDEDDVGFLRWNILSGERRGGYVEETDGDQGE